MKGLCRTYRCPRRALYGACCLHKFIEKALDRFVIRCCIRQNVSLAEGFQFFQVFLDEKLQAIKIEGTVFCVESCIPCKQKNTDPLSQSSGFQLALEARRRASLYIASRFSSSMYPAQP